MSRRRLRNNGVRRLSFESLCRRELLAGDMTNPVNSLDVNNDTSVTAGDALAVINYMARLSNGGEGELTGSSGAMYPDTNGDLKVTASDALGIINSLGEGETDNAAVTNPANNVVQANAPAAATANNNVGNAEFYGLIVDTGSSPRVKFSADHAVVTVTSTPAGQLRVTFNANNAPNPQVLSIRHGFNLQVIGSHNQITFDGAVIPDDLIIEIVTGGNNTVQLSNVRIGDDFLYHGADTVDNVILNQTFIADDAIIKTEGGNDRVTANGVQIGDDAIIRLGNGNDRANVANTRIGDVADIDGDGGFDTLAADVATVFARKLRVSDFEA